MVVVSPGERHVGRRRGRHERVDGGAQVLLRLLRGLRNKYNSYYLITKLFENILQLVFEIYKPVNIQNPVKILNT